MSKTSAIKIDSSSLPDAWAGEDLSVQYSSGSCYPAALEPEIRLMAMILEDAVNCFQRFAGAESNPGCVAALGIRRAGTPVGTHVPGRAPSRVPRPAWNRLHLVCRRHRPGDVGSPAGAPRGRR